MTWRMRGRPHGTWYVSAGSALWGSLALSGLVMATGAWRWQVLVGLFALLLLGVAYHIYLAWWRDNYETNSPGTPDPDPSRYEHFMDSWARKVAWRLGIRWKRP